MTDKPHSPAAMIHPSRSSQHRSRPRRSQSSKSSSSTPKKDDQETKKPDRESMRRQKSCSDAGQDDHRQSPPATVDSSSNNLHHSRRSRPRRSKSEGMMQLGSKSTRNSRRDDPHVNDILDDRSGARPSLGRRSSSRHKNRRNSSSSKRRQSQKSEKERELEQLEAMMKDLERDIREKQDHAQASELREIKNMVKELKHDVWLEEQEKLQEQLEKEREQLEKEREHSASDSIHHTPDNLCTPFDNEQDHLGFYDWAKESVSTATTVATTTTAASEEAADMFHNHWENAGFYDWAGQTKIYDWAGQAKTKTSHKDNSSKPERHVKKKEKEPEQLQFYDWASKPERHVKKKEKAPEQLPFYDWAKETGIKNGRDRMSSSSRKRNGEKRKPSSVKKSHKSSKYTSSVKKESSRNKRRSSKRKSRKDDPTRRRRSQTKKSQLKIPNLDTSTNDQDELDRSRNIDASGRSLAEYEEDMEQEGEVSPQITLPTAALKAMAAMKNLKHVKPVTETDLIMTSSQDSVPKDGNNTVSQQLSNSKHQSAGLDLFVSPAAKTKSTPKSAVNWEEVRQKMSRKAMNDSGLCLDSLDAKSEHTTSKRTSYKDADFGSNNLGSKSEHMTSRRRSELSESRSNQKRRSSRNSKDELSADLLDSKSERASPKEKRRSHKSSNNSDEEIEGATGMQIPRRRRNEIRESNHNTPQRTRSTDLHKSISNLRSGRLRRNKSSEFHRSMNSINFSEMTEGSSSTSRDSHQGGPRRSRRPSSNEAYGNLNKSLSELQNSPARRSTMMAVGNKSMSDIDMSSKSSRRHSSRERLSKHRGSSKEAYKLNSSFSGLQNSPARRSTMMAAGNKSMSDIEISKSSRRHSSRERSPKHDLRGKRRPSKAKDTPVDVNEVLSIHNLLKANEGKRDSIW